jgi:hypothetical protein
MLRIEAQDEEDNLLDKSISSYFHPVLGNIPDQRTRMRGMR